MLGGTKWVKQKIPEVSDLLLQPEEAKQLSIFNRDSHK